MMPGLWKERAPHRVWPKEIWANSPLCFLSKLGSLLSAVLVLPKSAGGRLDSKCPIEGIPLPSLPAAPAAFLSYFPHTVLLGLDT